MNGTCTRCGGNDRRVQLIVRAAAHGWWMSSTSFVPQAEAVCADCITDKELAYLLHPVVEFVLSTMPRSTELDMVHAYFQARNNSPTNRPAALRAVGLVGHL